MNEIQNKNIETVTTSNNGLKQQFSNSFKHTTHRSYGELPIHVLKTPNTSQSEFSPAQKRIKLLKNYGKTPPLNIVHTKPVDKKLISPFKTPTRF